jgi:hypothetical protein
LTGSLASHTLALVHRVATILLGVALVSTSGQLSALHTHLYTDHDHPEHQHGPAAHEHEHDRSAPHHEESDGAAHLESCDPGLHAVSITMGCTPVAQVDPIDAQDGSPGVVEPLVPVRSIQPFTDVRVHGPPPRTQAPPRAPPLNLLA